MKLHDILVEKSNEEDDFARMKRCSTQAKEIGKKDKTFAKAYKLLGDWMGTPGDFYGPRRKSLEQGATHILENYKQYVYTGRMYRVLSFTDLGVLFSDLADSRLILKKLHEFDQKTKGKYNFSSWSTNRNIHLVMSDYYGDNPGVILEQTTSGVDLVKLTGCSYGDGEEEVFAPTAHPSINSYVFDYKKTSPANFSTFVNKLRANKYWSKHKG